MTTRRRALLDTRDRDNYSGCLAITWTVLLGTLAVAIVALFYPMVSSVMPLDSNITITCIDVPINSSTCPAGGQRFIICENPTTPKVCDPMVDEILADKIICNGTVGAEGPEGEMGFNGTDGINGAPGAPGTAGVNGTDATPIGVLVTQIAFNSSTCLYGGMQIIFCYDFDNDMTCMFPPDVLISNETLCNGGAGPEGPAGKDGKDGINGTNGTNGVNGTSTAFNCTILSINNTDCPNGGTEITMCLDTTGDGDCGIGDENIMIKNICNGADGADGANGTGGIFCANYLFRLQTEDADPGNQRFRFNMTQQNLTTAIYISTTDFDMREIGEILLLAQTGSYIFVRSVIDPFAYFFFAVNEDPELIGGVNGYVRFPSVTLINSGGAELNQNELSFICLQFASSLAMTVETEVVQPFSPQCNAGGLNVTVCAGFKGQGQGQGLQNCNSVAATAKSDFTVCHPLTGLPVQYVEEEGGISVTGTSYTELATLNTASLPPGHYEIHWHWDALVDVLGLLSIVCLDGTAADCNDGITLDGPTIQLGTGILAAQVSGFRVFNLTAGTHDIYLSHSRETGILTAPTVSNQRIMVRYAGPP